MILTILVFTSLSICIGIVRVMRRNWHGGER